MAFSKAILQRVWTQSGLSVSWEISRQPGHALRMLLVSKVKSMACLNALRIISSVIICIREILKTLQHLGGGVSVGSFKSVVSFSRIILPRFNNKIQMTKIQEISGWSNNLSESWEGHIYRTSSILGMFVLPFLLWTHLAWLPKVEK